LCDVATVVLQAVLDCEVFFTIILYLKSEACVHVRLSVPRSQRALTLYTQRQTALLQPIYPVSAVVCS